MSAYFALFRARFRVLVRYRAAAWAGIGTQLMTPYMANPDPDVRKQILDGSVAYELARWRALRFCCSLCLCSASACASTPAPEGSAFHSLRHRGILQGRRDKK